MSDNPLLCALDIAKTHKLHKVLSVFEKCLGQMLNEASTSGNTECVIALVQAGAKVNFEDENFGGDPELAFSKYLSGFYQLHPHPRLPIDVVFDQQVHRTENCLFCMGHLMLNGEADEIKLVYRHCIRASTTPLGAAIAEQKMEVVNALLLAGADMHADIGAGRSNVHMTPVGKALQQGNVQILQLLIDHGLDVHNDIDINVMFTVHDNCLPLLLKCGLYTRWIQKHTPLGIAAGSQGARVHGDAEDRPPSLKYQCRTAIRQQLLTHNDENLFRTATPGHLKLPK